MFVNIDTFIHMFSHVCESVSMYLVLGSVSMHTYLVLCVCALVYVLSICFGQLVGYFSSFHVSGDGLCVAVGLKKIDSKSM